MRADLEREKTKKALEGTERRENSWIMTEKERKGNDNKRQRGETKLPRRHVYYTKENALCIIEGRKGETRTRCPRAQGRTLTGF